MSGKLIQNHDQFLKRLLDRPGAAGALLRERLPLEVAARLAPDPPELIPGSFVSDELREYHTDRLYRVRTVAGETGFIYVLVEHKSQPDPRIGLQLLGYLTRIWQRWADTEDASAGGARLPPVIPLVLYHGAPAWRVPTAFADAITDDPALRPWVLDFRYALVDLGRIADVALSREEVLRVGLLILKYGVRGGDLRQMLLDLGRATLALGVGELVALIRYLVREPNEVDAVVVRDVLKEILPGQEERIMSIAAEQWKAEGIAIGKAEGRAEGKAEGRAEAKAETLLRQLRRRFGPVPDAIGLRVRTATTEQLDAWLDNFVDAATLDAVFAKPPSSPGS